MPFFFARSPLRLSIYAYALISPAIVYAICHAMLIYCLCYCSASPTIHAAIAHMLIFFFHFFIDKIFPFFSYVCFISDFACWVDIIHYYFADMPMLFHAALIRWCLFIFMLVCYYYDTRHAPLLCLTSPIYAYFRDRFRLFSLMPACWYRHISLWLLFFMARHFICWCCHFHMLLPPLCFIILLFSLFFYILMIFRYVLCSSDITPLLTLMIITLLPDVRWLQRATLTLYYAFDMPDVTILPFFFFFDFLPRLYLSLFDYAACLRYLLFHARYCSLLICRTAYRLLIPFYFFIFAIAAFWAAMPVYLLMPRYCYARRYADVHEPAFFWYYRFHWYVNTPRWWYFTIITSYLLLIIFAFVSCLLTLHIIFATMFFFSLSCWYDMPLRLFIILLYWYFTTLLLDATFMLMRAIVLITLLLMFSFMPLLCVFYYLFDIIIFRRLRHTFHALRWLFAISILFRYAMFAFDFARAMFYVIVLPLLIFDVFHMLTPIYAMIYYWCCLSSCLLHIWRYLCFVAYVATMPLSFMIFSLRLCHYYFIAVFDVFRHYWCLFRLLALLILFFITFFHDYYSCLCHYAFIRYFAFDIIGFAVLLFFADIIATMLDCFIIAHAFFRRFFPRCFAMPCRCHHFIITLRYLATISLHAGFLHTPYAIFPLLLIFAIFRQIDAVFAFFFIMLITPTICLRLIISFCLSIVLLPFHYVDILILNSFDGSFFLRYVCWLPLLSLFSPGYFSAARFR